MSPFKDCLGNFGKANRRRFDRPFDGKVNGYIKFNWPKERKQRRLSALASNGDKNGDAKTSQTALSFGSTTSAQGIIMPFEFDYQGFDFAKFQNCIAQFDVYNSVFSLPSDTDAPVTVGAMGAPRMVPKMFGYEADMDHTDRKLWTFCTQPPSWSVLVSSWWC